MEDAREASVVSSTDFYESDKKPDTPARHVQHDVAPGKRKAAQVESSPEKKRRLESPSPSSPGLKPCAGLPPAVWQHIFLYCPLKTLGRLLQVNRSFHSYLTHVRNVPTAKPNGLRLLKSESIWVSARNMHPTKPPKPLPGFGERQMWQLVWSNTCQFCGKQNSFTPGEKIWQKGPGAAGVRIIWPFGVRVCGSCLLQTCQTDASLLFSTASALRPALPFAFVTSDQNYIPAYTLQAATTPAGVEIIKYYYKGHVEDISKELEHALSLGSAAAEEWSKGLESRGKERMKAAENWERWEVKYRWWKDHQEPKRAMSVASSPTSTTQRQLTKSPIQNAPSPVIHAPVPATPLAQHAQPRPLTIPPQGLTPQPVPSVGPSGQRGERNLHDANEAKASRKLDIERRCQQMDPPIPPNVLRHMDSFKAAIQIPQPMNDYAWSMLQPRLLAQLPAAQQAESDHTSRLASMTTRAADRRQHDASLKEVKEVMDREWEESQRPVRDRLSAFADDFINQDWDHGRAVTYDNSPKFAVDLLVYVRRKFYGELEENVAPQTSEGTDSRRPKLVLENMKWVYDNKLKPLTEQFRKELFLCYGNGCEGNTRFYGFEGVIQHFGAKHTNAFSVGNVVVAWREAEWPEETPFHPDPISVKHAYQGNGHGQSGFGSYYGGYTRAGTSTPHMQAHLPQASPGPYSYSSHYNGPFAPPQATTHPLSGYDYGGSYSAQLEPYSYQPMGPLGYGTQGSNSGYATSPAVSSAAVAPPLATHLQVQGANDPLPQSGNGNGEYRTQLYDKQVSTIIEMAQDTWKQTSGIKDFPNSLRIYVLLHRVISKFQIEFNHEPTLSHFIDALSNHEIPRALKNAPGLSCKACQEDFSYSSTTLPSRAEERRTYTVLTLFSHFQSQHGHLHGLAPGNRRPSTQWDWKEDMIELPSDRFISGLIHAPGMDDDKLLMVATVFPKLFPTPLPRIGVVDSHGVASPAHSITKDHKDLARTVGTPGVSTEKSGPSSLASLRTDSPRPPKPNEDEYDPQRPALPAQSDLSSRMSNRKSTYHCSPPPSDRRPRYYAEPRYYLPREPMDSDFSRPVEYVEVAPSPRRVRDSGLMYDEHSGRRPMYREHEAYYPSGRDDHIVYAHPREGYHEYESHSSQVRYLGDNRPQPEYRFLRETGSGSREHGLSRAHAEADRFLDELSGQPSAHEVPYDGSISRTGPKPPVAEQDPDDGSRYTPPPPDVAVADLPPASGPSLTVAHPAAPSTVSNGSRYEDKRPVGRQIPTPDSAGRRAGSHRRRDRHHDHVPSRYNQYANAARDEPYSRGASVSRAQGKKYERYEEQRRRIDQQETPQLTADRDYDPPYSRDQSIDQAPPDDIYYQGRTAPREYVSVQDRLHPYSPPRYHRAQAPMYVDEYGRPIEEYEVIRVPRDHRPYPHARYYPERESGHIQYVYDRPPPHDYDGRPTEYVYYEERERPPPARRTVFDPESEASYEPPPPAPVEVKVESAPASVPEIS